MKRIITCCVAAVLVVGCSKDNKEMGAKPTYYEEAKQSVSATVKSVDYSTRMVTLRKSDGNDLTFKAGPAVRNLEQLKVGDRVTADYYESVSIKVQAPGEAVTDLAVAAGRAQPGEKPGGMVGQQATVTATVEQIDKKTGKVMLREPAGRLRTVTARNLKKLENVQVGDRVIITYSEMLAVDVREEK